MSSATYPLRMEGRLDAPLSRWLWLVKWLLAIPHFFVLGALWVVFGLFTVFAFFAILVTGRYPRALFDVNVGVLRWTWRVMYYSYGANGTDRYPPFTLKDVPDYPARLDVEYPERLSRGLVLVKSWLLAIPHLLIVGLLAGGVWWAWSDDARFGGGLIGILVFVAAVMLAFTGTYPQGLFDFILGLNRWVLRVAAYTGLMTDEYPPFRLDSGGDEPNVLTMPSPPPPPAPPGRGWTGGRVVAVVVGSMLLLGSLGPFVGGGVAWWADTTQRDAAGFLTSGTARFATPAYALTTDAVDLRGDGPGWLYPSRVLGDVRVTVRDARVPVFIGIGPADDVDRYLGATAHAVVTDWSGPARYRTVNGGEATSAPGSQTFWVAQAGGTGTQSVTWEPESGTWALVVMNADGSANVAVRVSVGLKAPALGWVAFGLLLAGVALAVPGAVLVVVAVRRAGRGRM